MTSRILGDSGNDNYDPSALNGAWMVIIEWDGAKPPTVFYNRLQKLGYKVRGNKEISPLARRNGFDGVISQEGLIVTRSESSARTIAGFAYRYNARAVSVARAQFDTTYGSAEDRQVLESIQGYFGQKGRRATPSEFTVTCHECAKSSRVETDKPICCPKCGSFNIAYRSGSIPFYFDAGKVSPVEAWTRSRFNNGLFESARLSNDLLDNDSPLPQSANIPDGERETVNNLVHSELCAQLEKLTANGKLTRESFIRFLDAGYCVIRQNAETRQRNRLEGIARYFARGGNPENIILTTNVKDVDLLDTYSIMDETAIESAILL